jgi:hypothetical protein
MGAVASCIMDRIIVKGANKLKNAMAPLLAVLTFFVAIETMVILFFGIKYGCVKPATVEGPPIPDTPTKEQKELAKAKKDANLRLVWAVLCLLVTTLGSIGIGSVILNTNYNRRNGAHDAKDQLAIFVGVTALRTLISLLVIGALLFGQFTGRDQKLCCCACILAPLTMCLPLFTASLLTRDAIPTRDVEDQDAGVEYPRLLSATDKDVVSPSSHLFAEQKKKVSIAAS